MSHDGWDYMPEQPRTCRDCGVKLTMKHGAWFQTLGEKWSLCWACVQKWRLARV
jgi:hypothetical protein